MLIASAEGTVQQMFLVFEGSSDVFEMFPECPDEEVLIF